MSNIRRTSDFRHQFSFSSREEEFSIYFDRFLASDPGKTYQGIPWEDLVRVFGLKDLVIISPKPPLFNIIIKLIFIKLLS